MGTRRPDTGTSAPLVVVKPSRVTPVLLVAFGWKGSNVRLTNCVRTAAAPALPKTPAGMGAKVELELAAVRLAVKRRESAPALSRLTRIWMAGEVTSTGGAPGTVMADSCEVASVSTILLTCSSTPVLTLLAGDSAADAMEDSPAVTATLVSSDTATPRLLPAAETEKSTESAVAAPAALTCTGLDTSADTADAADCNAEGVDALLAAALTVLSSVVRTSAAAVALPFSWLPGSFSIAAALVTSATAALAVRFAAELLSVVRKLLCAAALVNTCCATLTLSVAGAALTPPSALRASTSTCTVPAGNSAPSRLAAGLQSDRLLGAPEVA